MNALVVFAHPNHNSLNGALLKEALRALESNPDVHEVRLLDLYASGFDPVLRFGEERRRRDMQSDPAFAEHRDLISRADQLVFIYPIWWGRPPAILLGFFDQILASGFAYEQKEKSPLPVGLLKGKKVTCIYTMKGPKVYARLFLNNAHQVLMKRAVFNFVGIRKVQFIGFGNMEKTGGKQAKALTKVQQRMRR